MSPSSAVAKHRPIEPAAEHLRDRCFTTTRFRCIKVRYTSAVCGCAGSVEIEPSALLPVGGEDTPALLSCGTCLPPGEIKYRQAAVVRQGPALSLSWVRWSRRMAPTGPDHFRTVPEAGENPAACVLSFGASFTFGDGVHNDEAYPAQIVKLSGGRVAAQNFAVSGWGLHQILAGLQSGRFPRSVRCRPTDAVLLMIPSLIWRTGGIRNPWDTHGPRYRLGSDGQPVRDGTFADPDPYNWRRWIGLDPVNKADALSLAKAVIVEAFGELRRLYPNIRTHLILYRVASWTDVGLNLDDLVAFEYDLHEAGIMPLPLEAVIPRYRFAQGDYVLDPSDLHPNARAHRLIAEFVLREIKP